MASDREMLDTPFFGVRTRIVVTELEWYLVVRLTDIQQEDDIRMRILHEIPKKSKLSQ
jgi:hypothetical protein